MPRRLPEIDAFKGILICLIVFGHNTLFSGAYPVAFNVLYNFHVASFLLLPCIFFTKSVESYQFKQRLVRYGVPQLFFFLLCAVLFLFLYGDLRAEGVRVWLQNAGVALLFSTEGKYKAASGFGLFWFLPALFALVLLRSAVFAHSRALPVFIISVGILAQLLVGEIPPGYLPYLPFSLPLVLFLLPVGLVAGRAWARWGASNVFLALSGLVFALCIFAGLKTGSSSALAGDPRVYSILQPGKLVFHDIYLLAAFFGLMGLARLIPGSFSRVLQYLGQQSLVIFLVHSLVWQLALRIGLDNVLGKIGGWPLWGALTGFIITIGVSSLAAALLAKVPRLHAMIFPRDFQQWRLAWAGNGQAAGKGGEG